MQTHTSNERGEVLVAVMNSPADFEIANIQSATPLPAIPAVPPLQKEEQAELFQEMPKSKKRKRQKRKQ